jgi:hypothetical protein
VSSVPASDVPRALVAFYEQRLKFWLDQVRASQHLSAAIADVPRKYVRHYATQLSYFAAQRAADGDMQRSNVTELG